MFSSPAFAQVAGSAAPGGSIMDMLLPLAFMFLIMYFLLIRPQNKRMKQHREMVANVKRGDTVVTSGGLVGKVKKVKDDEEIEVEISKDVVVKVVKSTLADVRTKGEPEKSE
ncbi:preprotein translocase subunit YajC [Temperatibacter marinus]|uniref:Sec translocon accessory complex subunit YajC n=1 Tax=Temperatibacter marinus TaxID=1456591 RepID=A0AA52H981_9PROT|nr:preprotein translocase subunit YajC [Temperatibacter marinus]WND02619.1 preprotein translocase subunit YajC [Temperatibacter marinus]